MRSLVLCMRVKLLSRRRLNIKQNKGGQMGCAPITMLVVNTHMTLVIEFLIALLVLFELQVIYGL